MNQEGEGPTKGRTTQFWKAKETELMVMGNLFLCSKANWLNRRVKKSLLLTCD